MALLRQFGGTLMFLLGLGCGLLVSFNPDKEAGSTRLQEDSARYSLTAGEAEPLHVFYQTYSGTVGLMQKQKRISPIFLNSVPGDLADLSIADRKELFISLMLPLVLKTNLMVLEERAFVIEILEKKQRFAALAWWEKAELKLIQQKYGTDQVDELLRRIDTIPLSLAVSQAIIESGWGTSRFAKQANAFFGVHASAGGQQDYLVSKHGGVRVAAYESLSKATEAYVHLLNTGGAYASFRQKRADLRAAGQYRRGYVLAGFLHSYSELGGTYVESLRAVMSRNGLELLDEVRFGNSVVVYVN